MATVPGHRDGEGEGLTVLPGGRSARLHLLVIDVDDDAVLMPFPAGAADAGRIPALSSDEMRALSRAVDADLEIAAVAAFHVESACRVFDELRRDVTVLADGALDATHATAVRGGLRLERLLRLCRDRGIPLRDVAVIAARPEDRSMMLEAGVAFALETAGYDVCSAADAVFPSRCRGGLAAAVDAVAALRTRSV